MSNWIFVETYHNWLVDYNNNFKFTGVYENKFVLKNIDKGDKFFTYISKKKIILDLREIVDKNLHAKPKNYNYDKEFKKFAKTKLIKLLPENKWISLQDIKNKLRVFEEKRFIPNKLLNAPILLDTNDYNVLKEFFN